MQVAVVGCAAALDAVAVVSTPPAAHAEIAVLETYKNGTEQASNDEWDG